MSDTGVNGVDMEAWDPHRKGRSGDSAGDVGEG